MRVIEKARRIMSAAPKWKPKISIIVVVYKMAKQAENTLWTLSKNYQEGVSSWDYEVIVVENASTLELGKKRVKQFGSNFKYIYRDNQGVSPVPSINFAVNHARGDWVCIMIDGARMVTPGTIRQTLAATRLSDLAVISVPGYHLGRKVQQEAMKEGYTEEYEEHMLSQLNWKSNGYKLFEFACFSSTSKKGVFLAGGESNCITISRKMWRSLRGYDDRFVSSGGGLSNLDFYKRACEYPGAELINVAGEGSFHQFHGGVTTGQEDALRKKAMEEHFSEYERIRGDKFRPPKVDAKVFGTFASESLLFVVPSVELYWQLDKYSNSYEN